MVQYEPDPPSASVYDDLLYVPDPPGRDRRRIAGGGVRAGEKGERGYKNAVIPRYLRLPDQYERQAEFFFERFRVLLHCVVGAFIRNAVFGF